MISNFADPGKEYLAKLGELAYGVGSLEWLLLGDLYSHSAILPPELNLENLMDDPTGAVANKLIAHAPKITDPKVKAYYLRGGEILKEVSLKRNSAIHARPATKQSAENTQRLYRRSFTKPTAAGEAFWVDDQFLDEVLEVIDKRSRELNELRP